ncbi:hypothetical protein METBIDRAFT_71005 [Metschnikowia bicuspidata var. bicuspidata NRRL YB-4993]|uniref:Transcription factor BYE1 n=1 Tax=Metschnikowia bicuspidata var. bicuspidata NRRL YB-4993 TaxID=869754 RepID=A0A1A0H8D0_9ASCO|nr:hypothetical protein METBIDRAFT_71005 [Metschnikowia bicuspidata var. bicuspidata NRRL YB-4993]OBA20281.1 hypothetical protein METBIDRAFT_71005 [Metschnikowia bicuspidata var. bicuspidata NRRL YB-4993]
MEEEIRRSSRTNKGTHTGRAEHDVYYLLQGEEPALKKAKTAAAAADSDDGQNLGGTDEDEGKVRCDGCGTTEENYDEETDDGGMMIECEHCKTWQHARCMGYRSEKQIPELYLCNRCGENAPLDKKDQAWEIPQAPKDSTRANVAKALVNVIVRANSAVAGADAWGQKLEAAVYAWAGATDKKYIEKSRSVMALVKKPAVLMRLISHELSPTDFTLLPVEDIDPELKDYAEKVRQALIRRSVLTVSDDLSQRIRRTHKGEEIVETKTDENNDDLSVGMIARNVDHRKFSDDAVAAVPSKNSGLLAPSLYQLGDDDDDYSHVTSKADGERDESDGASDDELNFILAAKDPQKVKKAPPPAKQTAALALPPTMPTGFWAGEIAFPDVATFGVLAEFVSCTNYEKPKDNVTVSFHNKAMRVCKELMEKKKYQIEGRLDRSKADPYLLQIVKSRDLYLVKLKKEDPSYSKVYEYLLKRSKVGVLSGRAPMVKDAYLFALNHDAPSYMNFTAVGEGLYVLFSVKKDYVPVGKSILKKSLPVARAPLAAVANLDNILLKLEGTISTNMGSTHLPPRPAQMPLSVQQQQPPQDIPPQLSQDQMSYLSSIVQQNPHVQSDPQALLNLLQLMQT